jgi:hypothetical protein
VTSHNKALPCPVTKLSTQDHSLTKESPWWNEELSGLRIKTRRVIQHRQGDRRLKIPIRRPSVAVTKKDGNPKSVHGVGRAKGLRTL